MSFWCLAFRHVTSNLSGMNVDAYLKRIRYLGPREPNAETLRQLQLAHLRTVPFENLSIHAGEPIVLNDEALYRKIVERNRGGFCYEANGSFAALLRALGFDVAILAAGVAKGGVTVPTPDVAALGSVEFGPIFDHMALMVNLSELWLVDVGFGDSFQEPLLLDSSVEQRQGSETFCIVEDNGKRTVLRKNEAEGWSPQFRFTLDTYSYADYEDMCHFHETSPDSHFTKARICSRLTEHGRITLSDLRLITLKDGKREERMLADEEEYAEVLMEEFGIWWTDC